MVYASGLDGEGHFFSCFSVAMHYSLELSFIVIIVLDSLILW